MKVKLIDISNAKEILTKIANTELPAKTSYMFLKLIQKLNEEFTDIETCRTNLIKKYGEQDEQENIRVIPETENFEKFMYEYNEFMDTEVEINMHKIELNLDNVNISIKPIELANIEKFVDLTGMTVLEEKLEVEE